MRIMYLIATTFSAAIAAMSAVAKLRRDPKVVGVIHTTTGVPMRYLSPLAACELAGAFGLIAGMWWPPIGVAAGVGLVIYFIGAVIAHLRVGDMAGSGPAVFVLVLVSAALATRLLTM